MAEFPGIAQTFAEVIDQTSQAQEDLEELSRSGKAGGYTVACLSTETILLRRTLRKLHEYCQENQRLLKGHSKTTAKDINLSLLSTSLALSEIKIKARKITLRGVSVRTPRLRLFERAKKEDNELNPLLCKLRDHSILLWSLYLILDPFAEPDEEVFQLRTHVRIMLRQTEDDINQQPNVKCMATRPDYISTLWLTRVSPLPLTKELIHHGLSHDQIHTIYGNSSGRPFIAKQVLLRWRSYGTENDFRVALNLLISTGYDLMLTDEAIRSWRSYGVGDMYSMFLGLLASSRYDLPKTEEAIQTLLTWESHSTVEEYQLCLDLLGTNYYDVRLVDEAIRDFQSCGRDLYPILLKASHKAYFNVRLIRQLLRRATVLMTRRNLPDQTSLALENLPLAELTPPNCQHLINAMELKGYELLKVVEELEILRYVSFERIWPSTSFRKGTPSFPSSCPVDIYLDLWQSCGYDVAKATGKLNRLIQCVGRKTYGRNWTIPTALIVLKQFKFRERAFFLTIATKPDATPIIGTVLCLIGCNAEKYRILSIVSNAITVANYMHHSWRISGLETLSRNCDFDLSKMCRIHSKLKSSFPSSFLKRGLCWDWLAFNNFDLELTIDDAVAVSDDFIFLDRFSKRKRIVMMHQLRGLHDQKPRIQYWRHEHLFNRR